MVGARGWRVTGRRLKAWPGVEPSKGAAPGRRGDVALGVTRFDEIQRDLGLSRKVLTERLDTLVKHDVLERRPYQHNPLRHDYLLTEKGRDLIPALMAIMAWGDRWTAEEAGPPLLLRHHSCGHHTSPTVTCLHCVQPLTLEELTPHAGPGARDAPGTRVIAKRLQPE